jgi:hypothetical protein
MRVPNSHYLYGINFAMQLFVGRLGNLELSTATIDLSVVSTSFSFAYVGASTYMWFRCSVSNEYRVGGLHVRCDVLYLKSC